MFPRYLDPIFFGDYPKTMCERLGDHLPKLSEKDRENLGNSIDFVGLNHYTTRFISHVETPREIHFYQVQEMERNGTYQDWNSHLEFFFFGGLVDSFGLCYIYLGS